MNEVERAEFIQYLIEHVARVRDIDKRPDKFELVEAIYANSSNDKYTILQSNGQYRFTDEVCEELNQKLDFRTTFNEKWRQHNTTWELFDAEIAETDPDEHGVRFQYIKLTLHNAVRI